MVASPTGEEVPLQVGEDVADRISEGALLEALRTLRLPPVEQERPTPGPAESGERAVELSSLPATYRGAQSAVAALGGRVPEARAEALITAWGYDRFTAALQWLSRRKLEEGEGHG